MFFLVLIFLGAVAGRTTLAVLVDVRGILFVE
jgi:hypothetical protein